MLIEIENYGYINSNCIAKIFKDINLLSKDDQFMISFEMNSGKIHSLYFENSELRDEKYEGLIKTLDKEG